MPSWRAIAATSAAESAMIRQRLRSEPPYPGRSYVIRRAPVDRMSSSFGWRSSRQPGVPCNAKTGLPLRSPHSAKTSLRPSGASATWRDLSTAAILAARGASRGRADNRFDAGTKTEDAGACARAR
jgi:hypothetical protein